MVRRLAALTLAGSLALSSLPALAEDGSSSSSSTVSSSVSSAMSSTSSTSSASNKLRKPVRKLINKIGNRCERLRGRARADCVHGANFGQVVRAVRQNVHNACGQHARGSTEFRMCMSEEKTDAKSNLMDYRPRAMNVRRHVKNMMPMKKMSSSSASSN